MVFAIMAVTPWWESETYQSINLAASLRSSPSATVVVCVAPARDINVGDDGYRKILPYSNTWFSLQSRGERSSRVREYACDNNR